VNERKELLNMFREMWQKGDSPLHRVYSSWEELEKHVDIKTERTTRKEKYTIQPCPNCGVKQRVTKSLEMFFPFQNCKSCKHAFYVNRDLTVRRLTEEEKEDMPAA
jgi:ssDNA-binding Zn-finger/Zn-ribbon topoisomerase 1